MKDTIQPRFVADKTGYFGTNVISKNSKERTKERKKKNNITGEETKIKNRDVIGQEIRKEKDKNINYEVECSNNDNSTKNLASETMEDDIIQFKG